MIRRIVISLVWHAGIASELNPEPVSIVPDFDMTMSRR
jgi:hypothetical protein